MSERKRKTSKKVSSAQQATVGTTIRLEQPKSGRKQKPNVVVVAAQDFRPVTGFAKFIRDYGVIGVAVGFAIASQAQLLIKSLIDNFINPLYPLIFNSGRIESKTGVIHLHNHASGQIKWGLFATQFVNFIFVLAIIYMIVKVLALDKLDKNHDKK